MAKAVPTSNLPDDTVREAVSFIAKNLRPADRAEISATLEGDHEEILLLSTLASSHAWIIVDTSGLPIGICGVAPTFFPDIGTPWMVGTEGIEREALSFIRGTRAVVSDMQAAYPILTNHVDVRNDAAMDWLLWAGFTFTDASPRYGVEGRPFIQFTRTSPLSV